MKNGRGSKPYLLVGILALLAVFTQGVRPPSAGAVVADAQAIVADWPKPSRFTALAMIERHGQPERGDERALTWFGIYRGLRTVVHRAEDGGEPVEQVVRYRVPKEKVEELARFDGRLSVNAKDAELSARTGTQRTNFLVLNLAHEIASGFRTVSEAQAFYERQTQLAEAGKNSRYRDRLIFEEPLPGSLLWTLGPAVRNQ